MKKKIAIVGSGILGLTCALMLDKKHYDITVFEASDRIGGLASAWKIGDIEWDKHYHVTLLSDSKTKMLVEKIGLGDQFEWVETKTGFYTDGELYSMSNSFEFLKFPPLDLISKFRLGGTIFYASKVKNWKALERIGVEEWLTKLSGKKTFDKMWKPLLRAKLGDAYKETAATFIWATIQRMYAARNSGLKKEMFGYVRGGYARIFARFAEYLEDVGVELRTSEPVTKISRQANGVSLESDLSSYSFDEVIVTCNPSISARIVDGISDKERETLNAIKYQGIVCASLLTSQSLSEFYVTNITDPTPFTGIIEMSALVDKKEFGGKSLIYLPKYVSPDDPLFAMSDEEIEDKFLGALEKMYPSFTRNENDQFRVSRVKEVFPIPVERYSESVPGFRSSVEGVYLLNSSQIVNGTLNVNDTAGLALRFLEERGFGIES